MMLAQETKNYLAHREWQVMRWMARTDGDGEFCPLFVRSLIPEGRLTFRLFMKVYDNAAGQIQYHPFLPEGEILQEVWLAELRRKGLDRLYYHKEELVKVIAYLNNHLLFLDMEKPSARQEKLEVMSDHLSLTLQYALGHSSLANNIYPVIEHVDQVLGELEKDALPWASLWEVLSWEYGLYHHAINVFLLSFGFMRFLNKEANDCRIMSLAALLHDVGLTKVPHEVLYKTGPPNDKERRMLEKHPRHSFNMLKGCPTLPPEVLRLILEHHEYSDGSGYPQGLPLWQQDRKSVV